MPNQSVRVVVCAAAFLISFAQVSGVGAQGAGPVAQAPVPQLAPPLQVVPVPPPQLAPLPGAPGPAVTPLEPSSPQLFNVPAPAAAPVLVPAVSVDPAGAPESELSPVDFAPPLSLIEPPALGSEAAVTPEATEALSPVSTSAAELPSVPVPASPAGSFVYVGTNQFGRWVEKPAPRPYMGLDASDLDAFQRDAIQLWENNKISSVWVYDIEPGPENDWAGWGPPPPGYVTRSLIPRTEEGAFLGADLPWPPAGQPPAR